MLKESILGLYEGSILTFTGDWQTFWHTEWTICYETEM